MLYYLRKALPHPQVISTDRHILQGWVDLKDICWDVETKTLSGTAHVIGGEPLKIFVANNGAKLSSATKPGGGFKLGVHPADDLSTLTLYSDSNADVKWSLKYE